MTYDFQTHRYALTKNGVLSELGENLNITLSVAGDASTSMLANRLLKRVSQVVSLSERGGRPKTTMIKNNSG